MTDLRGQLARLLDDEPDSPYDLDAIVRSGRRARWRRNAAVATAGTAGAAGLAAAVVVPALALGGDKPADTLSVPPTPSPSASSASTAPGKCYLVLSRAGQLDRQIKRLVRSGKVGEHPTITRLKPGKTGGRGVREVCTQGTPPADLRQGTQEAAPQSPAGPPYEYSEQPEDIAGRLGAQLDKRVSSFGLAVTYTLPFAQETSRLDRGRPAYFTSNVDVRDSSGYADIGVQVTHEVTGYVPFTEDCTARDDCVETVLPDGSVLRTGKVKAGPGNVILTAEVHRPDGVVVQAQMSNYPFGPDAATQPRGDLPLTLDELVSLAKDRAFTF